MLSATEQTGGWSVALFYAEDSDIEALDSATAQRWLVQTTMRLQLLS